MTCINCGANIETEDKFCNSCGKAVISMQDNTALEQTQPVQEPLVYQPPVQYQPTYQPPLYNTYPQINTGAPGFPAKSKKKMFTIIGTCAGIFILAGIIIAIILLTGNNSDPGEQTITTPGITTNSSPTHTMPSPTMPSSAVDFTPVIGLWSATLEDESGLLEFKESNIVIFTDNSASKEGSYSFDGTIITLDFDDQKRSGVLGNGIIVFPTDDGYTITFTKYVLPATTEVNYSQIIGKWEETTSSGLVYLEFENNNKVYLYDSTYASDYIEEGTYTFDGKNITITASNESTIYKNTVFGTLNNNSITLSYNSISYDFEKVQSPIIPNPVTNHAILGKWSAKEEEGDLVFDFKSDGTVTMTALGGGETYAYNGTYSFDGLNIEITIEMTTYNIFRSTGTIKQNILTLVNETGDELDFTRTG